MKHVNYFYISIILEVLSSFIDIRFAGVVRVAIVLYLGLAM